MDIIECFVINSFKLKESKAASSFEGCNDDCYSDDGDCPSFCDHEWGC